MYYTISHKHNPFYYITLTIGTFGILLWLLVNIPYVSATTITVDTLDGGTTSGDGHCSFSEAITAANTDTATDACPAGNGADEIVFGIPGELVITNALPMIRKEVTVLGHPNGTTLNFNNTPNYLDIGRPMQNNPEDLIVIIKDIEIKNFTQSVNTWETQGGVLIGIYSCPTCPGWSWNVKDEVYLENLYIHDNDAPGIAYLFMWDTNPDEKNPKHTHIEIKNSIIENNRTGIISSECEGASSLYITNSLIQNNNNGGIMHACGHMVISNSSIVRNTKPDSGAGIYIQRQDSGNFAIETELINTTVAGNQSTGTTSTGAGIFISSQPNPNDSNPILKLTNVTIANNSAPFGASGLATETNSDISAINTAIVDNTGTQCALHNALITNIKNASSDTSCGFTYQAIDSELLLLADNGGIAPLGPNGTLGHVLTMLPLETSQLLGRADSNHCPQTDEIGTIRPQGGGCDIGAIEIQEAPTPTPSPTILGKQRPRQENTTTGNTSELRMQIQEQPKTSSKTSYIEQSQNTTTSKDQASKPPEKDSKNIKFYLWGFLGLLGALVVFLV